MPIICFLRCKLSISMILFQLLYSYTYNIGAHKYTPHELVFLFQLFHQFCILFYYRFVSCLPDLSVVLNIYALCYFLVTCIKTKQSDLIECLHVFSSFLHLKTFRNSLFPLQQDSALSSLI